MELGELRGENCSAVKVLSLVSEAVFAVEGADLRGEKVAKNCKTGLSASFK